MFFTKSNTDDSSAAMYITILDRDFRQIVDHHINSIPSLIEAIIGFIAYILYMSMYHFGFILGLCILFIGSIHLLPPFIMRKFLTSNFIAADNAEAELTNHLLSGTFGFSTLKLLNLHSWFLKSFKIKQGQFKKIGVRASASGSAITSMTNLNTFLQQIGLVLILSLFIIKRNITIDFAFQVFFLSSQMYTFIHVIFSYKMNNDIYKTALAHLEDYIEPNNTDINNLETTKLRNIDGIVIKDLTFQRTGIEFYNNINLCLKKGEKCLIIGENGIGKSTLFSLLLGEFCPTNGIIIADNKYVKPGIYNNNGIFSWCSQVIPDITYYPSEFIDAFNDNSTLEEQEKLKIYLSDFGLCDEQLAKPFMLLSGGEKKKIFLAMTFAKNSPILLLDEPETMLDAKSLLVLKRLINEQKRTTIIISHNTKLYDDIKIIFRVRNNVLEKVVDINDQT